MCWTVCCCTGALVLGTGANLLTRGTLSSPSNPRGTQGVVVVTIGARGKVVPIGFCVGMAIGGYVNNIQRYIV